MQRALLSISILSVLFVSCNVSAQSVSSAQTTPPSIPSNSNGLNTGNGGVQDETELYQNQNQAVNPAYYETIEESNPNLYILTVPPTPSLPTPPVEQIPENKVLENQDGQAKWDWNNGHYVTNWSEQALAQAPAMGDVVYNEVLKTDADLQQRLNAALAEGKPYVIWVNVPSYTLRVYDTSTQQLLLTSRVIVGAPSSKTPIFETNVINLKYNPDWTPPASLVRKGKRYVPAGPNNPLGQVRFSTDNNMSIYLHDTNNHALFDRPMRALSAGCVRVSRWNELAQILSGDTSDGVTQQTEGNRTHFVKIPSSLVWISYQRVDLDQNNTLTVFPDVYGKQSLRLTPPTQ